MASSLQNLVLISVQHHIGEFFQPYLGCRLKFSLALGGLLGCLSSLLQPSLGFSDTCCQLGALAGFNPTLRQLHAMLRQIQLLGQPAVTGPVSAKPHYNKWPHHHLYTINEE